MSFSPLCHEKASYHASPDPLKHCHDALCAAPPAIGGPVLSGQGSGYIQEEPVSVARGKELGSGLASVLLLDRCLQQCSLFHTWAKRAAGSTNLQRRWGGRERRARRSGSSAACRSSPERPRRPWIGWRCGDRTERGLAQGGGPGRATLSQQESQSEPIQVQSWWSAAGFQREYLSCHAAMLKLGMYPVADPAQLRPHCISPRRLLT